MQHIVIIITVTCKEDHTKWKELIISFNYKHEERERTVTKKKTEIISNVTETNNTKSHPK